MSMEPQDIRDTLHSIADLITVGDDVAARSAVLELARRVIEGTEPAPRAADDDPLTSKERIELLAGRELIMRMRDQLANAKGTIEDLRARIGCHD